MTAPIRAYHSGGESRRSERKGARNGSIRSHDAAVGRGVRCCTRRCWRCSRSAPVPAARATLKYGPIELSGSVDSQNAAVARPRSTSGSSFRTATRRCLRLDYDWLQDGRYIDRFDVPFIKRSKLYLLYRGVYDSFWGIAPGGRQKGVTEYDDRIGGPIIGPPIGTQVVNGRSCQSAHRSQLRLPARAGLHRTGIYTRTGSPSRDALAYDEPDARGLHRSRARRRSRRLGHGRQGIRATCCRTAPVSAASR